MGPGLIQRVNEAEIAKLSHCLLCPPRQAMKYVGDHNRELHFGEVLCVSECGIDCRICATLGKLFFLPSLIFV